VETEVVNKLGLQKPTP